MKFVGGTHHGRDVPIVLRLVIHATRAKRVHVHPRVAGQTCLQVPSAPPRVKPDETYRVVTWRGHDRKRSKFLACAGLTHDEIEVMATRLFV